MLLSNFNFTLSLLNDNGMLKVNFLQHKENKNVFKEAYFRDIISLSRAHNDQFLKFNQSYYLKKTEAEYY